VSGPESGPAAACRCGHGRDEHATALWGAGCAHDACECDDYAPVPAATLPGFDANGSPVEG